MRTIHSIILMIVIVISGVNWWFLKKWFSNLVSKRNSVAYWLINALFWFALGYSWFTVRSSTFVVEPWIVSLLYFCIMYLMAEVILVALFPFLFAVRRLANYGKIPTRRTFLKKILYGTPIVAFGISMQGVYSTKFEMVTRRLDLQFVSLPHSLRGFKIAQISDTHIGTFFSLDRFDDVITLVKQEKPDVVVMTGDLIDDLSLLEVSVAKLSGLAALIPHGVYFCWGNHEYYRNITRIREVLVNSPIHILENSNAAIAVGETILYLVGVDYPWANGGLEKQNKQQQFLAHAQVGIPEDAFRILLAHHPDFISNAFAAQIPFTLSGHTHGGQINLFGRPLLGNTFKYMRGLYQQNQSYGYVSAGAGQWIPFRIGCPPELSIFTLT